MNRDTPDTEAALRELIATIRGVRFRFRCSSEGAYSLDWVDRQLYEITGLAQDIDMRDFREWWSRVPESERAGYLDSIEQSRRHLAMWAHEWPMDCPGGRIWLQGFSRPHAERDGSIIWNGLLFDVTERRETEAQLNQVRTDYRSVFENTTEGIFHSSPDGRLLEANGPLVRMHRCRDREHLLGEVRDLATDYYVDPADRLRILEQLERDGYVEGFEAEVYRVGTGERYWQAENVRAVRDAANQTVYYQGTVRDISEERRSRRLAEQRSTILERIARGEDLDGILDDIVETIEAYRPGVRAAILRLHDGSITVAVAPGLTSECIRALEQENPRDRDGVFGSATANHTACFVLPDHGHTAPSAALAAAMRMAGQVTLIVTALYDRQELALGFLALVAGSTRDDDAPLRALLHEMSQITAIALEQHQLAERMQIQAHYDPLTRLPNRVLLTDRINQLMLDAGRHARPLGVMLLDLDEFKLVNDTMGHAAGDLLLREVARRIQSCVRAGDTVARFGGDEFVFAAALDHPADATLLAERVLTALGDTFSIQGTEVSARPSIGIGLFPQDGRTMDHLLRAADMAMYAAKESGKNQYRYYDAAMNHRITHRLRIESELHEALAHGQLLPYFQPRVRLEDGRLTGGEALLRWQHPRRGILPPAEFLRFAEQSVLITEIDRYVLGTVTRQVVAWEKAGYSGVVAINLSAALLHQDNFARDVSRMLGEAGANPSMMELEITESMVMHDFERVSRELGKLRDRAPGLRIAIDDFGTGQSSLQYLARLPIDTLKIDRSFVAGLTAGEGRREARAITRTIVELGANLDLHVVAEGVETREQADTLQNLGCREAQGFLFSQPLPAADFGTAIL